MPKYSGAEARNNERFTLSRSERIASSQDIRALFKRGKRISIGNAKLFFIQNSGDVTRVGITFPRKYGRAVDRNRTKRLCRESFRLQKMSFLSGYDMLFFMFRDENESFFSRYSQIAALAKKAGLAAREGVVRG